MLPQVSNYEELIRHFEWHVPEWYNIGLDVCDKWAEREPQRVALIHRNEAGGTETYTFEDIRQYANQTAHLLAEYGIEARDRVGVLLPQAPETAYTHVAIYKMGAIAVPLFTLFGPEALAYRLRNSGAKVVVTNHEGAAKIARIRTELPQLEVVFDIEGESAEGIDFHHERARQPTDYEALQTRADDPALLIYTSGTTGPPKGALHAHRTLLGHLPGVEMSHDFFPQSDDRIWTPADWAWIGGLFDVLMPAWHHGITVVSHRFRKFHPEVAFQLMADYQVRNTFLPPTALKMMRAVETPWKRWPYALRSVASGGEPLGDQLLQWGKQALGLTINEFYGQTECNMVVSSCAAIMPPKPGCMGRPVPGHEVAIIDEEGELLPQGEQGQIVVKVPDPVMFLEYWQNPEATRRKFHGEWLLTGDVGVMDEEGYIRFVGRDDDIIISAGYRIGPGEIEDCLMGHPAVKMAAVVGVPDPTRHEIVKAFVMLAPGYERDEALAREIQAYVKKRLAAHEYPRQIEFVDTFPLTTTGKIMRRKLREKEMASMGEEKRDE